MPAKKDKKEKKVKAEEPKEEEEDAGSESEVEVEEKPKPKAKSAFALMAGDSDEDEEEEEQVSDKKKKPKAGGDAELSTMFGDSKKKKKTKEEEKNGDKKDEKEKDKAKEKTKDKDKKEKKEKKEKKKPSPLVCEVVEVLPIPKKDKLKLCKIRPFPDADPIDVVTSALNVVAGRKYVVAPPGSTTANGVEVKPSQVGGVESLGMFCGPNELGWAADELEANHAVMVADSVEIGSPAPSYEEALQMHRDRVKAEKEKAEAEAKAKKGGKKGAKPAKEPAKDEEDLDALLNEFGVEVKAVDTSAKGKKGKKGKQEKKQEEDDDFENALNEAKEKDTPAPAKEEPAKPEPAKAEPAKAEPAKAEEPAKEEAVDAKTLANRKKKDKKKAKQGADAAADEDFDAALDEFKEAAPAPAAAAAEEKKEAPAPAAAVEKKAEEEEEDEKEDGPVDAKTLANRKKKEKKKAQAKKSAGGIWAAANAADAAEAAAEVAAEVAADAAKAAAEKAEAAKEEAAKAKAEPKKGGKKESAIVKAARERMEAEKKLEEERLAFEAEQRRIIAEEEARIKAEEDRIEAERTRKREAKLAKIQRMKDDGTYQTKKQKEYAKRAAQLREQFGFDADDADEDGEKEEEEEKEKPAEEPAKATKISKKEMIEKKKKKKAQQEAAKEEKEEALKAEEPKPAEEAEVKAEEAPAAEEDNGGDDWEMLDEKLEDKKEEKEEKGSESDAEGSEDEDEDGESSDDESGSSSSSSSSSSSDLGYRSPIIVIMGHVDTGKTKLLDKIRKTNVQEGEAGGITQQIGATFFPNIALMEQTKKVDADFDIEVPGIMVIDTPGHESFNNLRARGSSLCDMAILVIDIMHGLEPQTVESLEMLKKRQCPFIIALNKIDVCYQWNSGVYTSIRSSLQRQEQFVRDEFEQRLGNVMLQLNERGLNVSLYWENEDPRTTVSIVPTSALTGEGVPDLLYNLIYYTQTRMPEQLEAREELQCTVIEVKNIEGLGTTIDVVLVNGTLREGDQIVLAGMSGAIVTTIRALLTPKPMKEMRVKGEYIHHPKISMSMGVKICAPGLDEAVAGTELLVVSPDDDIEELKEQVEEGFESVLNDFEKQPEGVYVKASTLGSLEALLSFLSEMKIPVFDVGIGEVHKKDVKKAAIMKEKKKPEFAVILCFDVKVNNEAVLQAKHDDVQIMTADIIYHLFDKFTTYMAKVQEAKKTETRQEAVFPVIMQIDKQYVFHKNDPFVFGCNVVGGQLRIGTPICVPEKDNLAIGHVGGIEKDHKPVQVARRGDTVCVKIEQNTQQTHITYGRHFDHTNQLYSLITRTSIDTLKEHFKDEMNKADWELIIAMKKVFQIG